MPHAPQWYPLTDDLDAKKLDSQGLVDIYGLIIISFFHIIRIVHEDLEALIPCV